MIRLLLFLIASVMLTGGTSMAESISTCSVDTVPIQIIGRWGGRDVATLSTIRLSSGDPNFNTFITTVTEHLAARLAQENFCLDSAESKARSLIQFADIYACVSEDDPILSALQPLEASPSDVHRIYSPWIDIAIERNPVPSVRAIVRFSERQLLVDQAVLSGAHNVPLGVAVPPTPREDANFKSKYRFATIYITEEPQEKPIEELVPPDFLWLLDRSSMGHKNSDSSVLHHMMRASTADYTKIVTALIDQCFVSKEAELRFNSVLDVADLVPLEQYKSKIQNKGRRNR